MIQKSERVITKSCSVLAFTLGLIFITVSFILSGFYRKQLFQQGVNFIYDYQSNGNSFTEVVYNLFSLFGHIPLAGPILGILYLVVYRKLNAFVYLLYIGFNLYLIAVSKQAFQDPRPFWYNEKIKQLDWVGCTSQYGFPSGHSWMAVLMYEPILTDFSGLGPYRWAFAIPLMFGSFIPISRMYLGVHSADQIVIGLTLSFTFLIMYKFFLQKYILRFLNYCVFAKTSKIPLVFITIVCNLIIFAIPLIIYHVNTTTNKVDQQVIDSVNKACNLSGSHLLNHEKIEMAHTMSGMVGSALFGAIYGLMMASCIGSRSSWSHYYFGFWAYRKKRNVVFKILIYIVLGFLTAGIFIIIIPHYVKNVYGRYVSASFGCVTAGMIVSFLTPYLALKGKIITIEEEQNEIIESPKSEKQKPEPTNEQIEVKIKNDQ